MTKDQVIMLRMVEAFSTGQNELLNAYLYEENNIPESIFASYNYGLAVSENNYSIDELKKLVNSFYSSLVSSQFGTNNKLLLKLKELVNSITGDDDQHSISKNVYKFILISLEFLGLNNLMLSPNDVFNSRLIQSAMGYNSTDNAILGNPDLVIEKLKDFFKVIKTKDKKSIESYMNDLNNIILSSIDFI